MEGNNELYVCVVQVEGGGVSGIQLFDFKRRKVRLYFHTQRSVFGMRTVYKVFNFRLPESKRIVEYKFKFFLGILAGNGYRRKENDIESMTDSPIKAFGKKGNRTFVAKTLLFTTFLWYNEPMDEKTQKIISALAEEFPNAKTELKFNSVYQLLVSVILSAQCTDKRVNEVTKKLFEVAPTPEKMTELSLEEVENYIHSCGFYHNKAKFILQMSHDLLVKYSGEVPSDLPSLKSLAGVGQKTANVVYAVGFGGQAIAVDTHVFRVSNRIGLACAKTVEQTERQLCEKIDNNLWSDAHHYILLHGRYVCKSQKPNCNGCVVNDLCDYYAKNHQ